MPAEFDQPGIEVLRTEVRHVRESIVDIRETLRSINSAVQALVRVEQTQVGHQEAISRAFKSIEDHESRLMEIENERGVINLVKNWVVAGVVGVIGLVALAVARMLK